MLAGSGLLRPSYRPRSRGGADLAADPFALDPFVLEPAASDPAQVRACEAWLEVQHVLAYQPENAREILARTCDPLEVLSAAGRLRTFTARELQADRRALSRVGARLVAWPSDLYPRLLRALADPPPVLAVRGCVESLSAPAVAIVGARAATTEGRETAHALAFALARMGLVVVSGLARGIDAAAHRGALDAGGRTVAVQGRGLDAVYPAEHARLARSIAARGAVIGELPVGAQPRAAHFPLRNRLISGLCFATVVVEARLRSGSLVTARHALAQGREVLAVPGALRAPTSAGPNGLIREGARPVLDVADVLEALPVQVVEVLEAEHRAREDRCEQAGPEAHPPLREAAVRPPTAGLAAGATPLDAPSRALLERLDRGPLDRDGLARALDATPAEIAARLSVLEIDGRVCQDRDGRWRRVRPSPFAPDGGP
jgi:DNA processing protein